MMKKWKRFGSLCLAVLMALALAVPGLAAGIDISPSNSIIVNNVSAGQTYKLYKMLDLSVNEGQTAYSYTVNSAWKDFFTDEGAGAAYVTIDDKGYVTAKEGVDMAAFGKAAAKYAEDHSIQPIKSITATAIEKSIVFNNLDSGYYLITSTLGTNTIVVTTPSQKDVVVNEKNAVPENKKEVQEDSKVNDSNQGWGSDNDADIGQTVNFKSTITAQAGAENYVFHDKMSKGLTYGSVTGITLNDSTVATSNYTVKTTDLTDDCTFEVVFTQAFCDTLKANAKIVISYTATLNDKAVVGLPGNPNQSQLSYGDSSNASNNITPPSETITYTWDFNVYKYTTSGDTEKPLAGATFTLSKNSDGSNPIKFVKVEDNVYRVATEDDTDTVTEITTDSTGKFNLKGLDADTYYLTETKAPDGYNKLSSSIKVVIDNEGKVFKDSDTDALADKTVKILNNTGTELPSTGGMGTTLFYAIGGILVVGAGVVLVSKKRMQ